MRMMRRAVIALGVVLLISCLGIFRVWPGLRRHHVGSTGEFRATLVHGTRHCLSTYHCHTCAMCYGIYHPAKAATGFSCVHLSLWRRSSGEGGKGEETTRLRNFVLFFFVSAPPTASLTISLVVVRLSPTFCMASWMLHRFRRCIRRCVLGFGLEMRYSSALFVSPYMHSLDGHAAAHQRGKRTSLCALPVQTSPYTPRGLGEVV